MFKIIYTFVAISFFTLSGCEGEKGLPGEPGNANVEIYNFSFTSNDFITDGDSRIYYYASTFNLPTNEASISVYIRSTSIFWYQLPFTDPTWQVSVNYYFDSPYLVIELRTDSGNSRDKFIQMFNNETSYQGRAVLIPDSQ